MRKPKTEKTEMDLLKPVNVSDIEANDCFGSDLYNPPDKDCSICADIELCGIKFQSLVHANKEKLEGKKGPFLDEAAFSLVDFNKIESLVAQYEKDGEPMLFDELLYAVAYMAKIQDDEAVVQFIKRKLPTNNLLLKEGKVYVKNSSN